MAKDIEQNEISEVCGPKRNTELESGNANGLRSGKTSSQYKSRPLRNLLHHIAAMSILLSGVVLFAASVTYFFGWIFTVQLILVALIAYLVASGKHRWFYVALMTAPRDIWAVYAYIRLLLQIRGFQKKNFTLTDVFMQNVAKHPNKVCLIFEDQEWTFIQLDEHSNKVANVFKNQGFKKGDVVGIYLENSPEHIYTLLGLAKLGVIVPLLNSNQRLAPLVHSITIAKCQAVVFAAELTDAITDVLDKLDPSIAFYQFDTTFKNKTSGNLRFHNFNSLVSDAPSTPPVVQEEFSSHDKLVYIYTSGTTGLPKAAIITNSKYIFITAGIYWVARFKHEDRFYCPLPLYHTAGLIMSCGQMLINGCCIVIRKKFSASAYFTECRKYECTVAQYIGEMCRYILAVPPKPDDKNHKLRLIFGNGLRPQIWAEFVDRFSIPRVAEFYGATEGNANIANNDNTVGAIGFVSRILPMVYPISIIKADAATGDPIRDARGFCIECGPNEPGVFIGKIRQGDTTRAYLGYVDQEASKKKLIYDVFKKGDSAFISGDLVMADELGYLFFKDRTGDTFRWKGENVSTSEIEAILSNLVSYKDCVVYGVEIRGMEGRAGMAAILDTENSIELEELAKGVRKSLPAYGRPIFVRILSKLDMTGTYKMKKYDLQKDGFNPNVTDDKIYYLDSKGEYNLVTKEIHEKINDGTIRV